MFESAEYESQKNLGKPAVVPLTCARDYIQPLVASRATPRRKEFQLILEPLMPTTPPFEKKRQRLKIAPSKTLVNIHFGRFFRHQSSQITPKPNGITL